MDECIFFTLGLLQPPPIEDDILLREEILHQLIGTPDICRIFVPSTVLCEPENHCKEPTWYIYIYNWKPHMYLHSRPFIQFSRCYFNMIHQRVDLEMFRTKTIRPACPKSMQGNCSKKAHAPQKFHSQIPQNHSQRYTDSKIFHWFLSGIYPFFFFLGGGLCIMYNSFNGSMTDPWDDCMLTYMYHKNWPFM